MSGQPAHTLATHLLNQTLTSIAILESLNVINPSDAHLIRSKLPSPTGPFPSLNPPADLTHSFGGLSVGGGGYQGQGQGFTSPSPGPPSLPPRGRGEQRARALWDYHGAEADDLTFRQGDTLIIDEEVNEQWYRGRVIPSGQSYPLERSGLFPSNYIEKTQPGYASPQPPPGSQGPGAIVPYTTTPPSYGYEKPYQAGGGGMVPYNPPQPPVVPAPAPAAVQTVMVQHEHKQSKLGKIGGQLGNAAVNGAGFGFGATIASDLVNKIF